MPKTDEYQPASNQQPNWVEVSTLIVLTMTLIAGSVLAVFAYQQNELTRTALEISSRPLLSAAFAGHARTKSGEKSDTTVLIDNLGKSPTKAHIRATTTYSLTNLDTPPLSSSEDVQIVWPGKGIVSLVEFERVLTDKQISDMKTGRGWIYRRVLITYGTYFTAICSQIRIKAHPSIPDRFILDNGELCSNPKTNDAN